MSLSAAGFILVFVALSVLSFRRTVYGLSLYFFSFFLHPSVWWWGDEVPDLRWNLIAACVLLVALARERLGAGSHLEWDSTAGENRDAGGAVDANQRGRPAAFLLAAAIFVNATVVHIFSADLAISVDTYVLLSKFVLLFALIYASVKTEADVRIVLWTLLLCTAYISYEVTINDRGDFRGGRLEGVGAAGVQGANQLASLFVTVLPLLGCLFFVSRHYAKILIALALGGAVNVVLLCNSRGAFLAVIVSAIVFLAAAPTVARKQALAGLLLASIGTFALLGDARIVERFMTTFETEERDSSSSARLVFWGAGLRAMAGHPFGSGGEAFSTYYSPVGTDLGDNRAVHNGFINEGIDWGVQGLALQLALIWSLTRWVRRRLRREDDHGTALLGAALLAATAGFLATSLFGSYLDDEWGYWLCALMLAFTMSNWKLSTA